LDADQRYPGGFGVVGTGSKRDDAGIRGQAPGLASRGITIIVHRCGALRVAERPDDRIP